MEHKSVLLNEAIDGLLLHEGDVYLDATLGGGGHAVEVYRRWKNRVRILGIDADQTAIEIAKEKLALSGAEVETAILNFRNIERVPQIFGVTPNKILFDLGWNSRQFEPEEGEVGRGFSFKRDEPLKMTFAQEVSEEDTTAYDVVNSWSEESLADVIYGYGEEKFARRIAKAIVEARGGGAIETSGRLSEIVKSAVPVFYRFGRIHPATKTFQAIRIAVNDELQALQEGLKKAFEILPTKGVVAVISFHSLEDRIVKNFAREMADQNLAESLTKKPITPSEDELALNPRSRSAKLRIIKKI